MIIVGVFAAAFFFPNQALRISIWTLDHFGYVVAVSAVIDGLILLGVARSRGWLARG